MIPIKAKAPKGLDVAFEPKEKANVLKSFQNTRSKLIESIQTIDLQLIYLNFKHPIGGLMSGYEWAKFTIVHAERHLRQAQRTLEQLKA